MPDPPLLLDSSGRVLGLERRFFPRRVASAWWRAYAAMITPVIGMTT
ncbi:hypothetical protein [Salinifilum ghardaiensis]